MTWNMYDPVIMDARRFGYPRQQSISSYKEQARIELLRRLALEDRIQELKEKLNSQAGLIDELKDKAFPYLGKKD